MMTDWQQRLAALLDEKNMTQAELARIVGVSGPSVHSWLGAGRSRPMHDLRAMDMLRACESLGVRPRWLMFGELPKWAAEEWPFSTPTEKVQKLPLVIRFYLDVMLKEAVLLFSGKEDFT
jgi:transcriptional regulator with XRE-family HTH domain